MSFSIKSNAKEVARALRRTVDDLGQFAVKDQDYIGAVTTRGIADHFSRLAGGGPDPTALGGDVWWERERNESLTMAERALGGKGQFPLLEDTGHMKGAFTTGAATFGTSLGRNASRFTHASTDPLAIQKAVKHHEGGRHEAVFERLGERTMMNFPKRKFIYWDTQMADEVRHRLTKTYFEAAVARHKA